jgi:hypothetical protein
MVHIRQLPLVELVMITLPQQLVSLVGILEIKFVRAFALSDCFKFRIVQLLMYSELSIWSKMSWHFGPLNKFSTRRNIENCMKVTVG